MSRPETLKNLMMAIVAVAAVASCQQNIGRSADESPFAPGVDPKGEAVDGLEVGKRLLEAGEYELALDAYTRAALDDGMTPDVMTGIAISNLGLGRLGQAEEMLRQVTVDEPQWPEAWNNLGVLLMEKGEYPEATLLFRKAYALDNGESDSIRDNLRLALANFENPAINAPQQKEEDYKLVQPRSGQYLIQKTP
ncbi:MAG: tetratricopeptide repeat protein [Pseudomonadota bacterium]